MAKVEEKIEKIITKPIEEIGYTIYDVEYAKEGKDYYLRIFIEKPNENIDITDCEKVSNKINETIEDIEIIKDQYYLEVSSTGIEKRIRKEQHLEKAIGKEISINLFKKDEKGKKEYKGTLQKFNDNTIEIENIEKEKTTINRKDISHIKTVYNWNNK